MLRTFLREIEAQHLFCLGFPCNLIQVGQNAPSIPSRGLALEKGKASFSFSYWVLKMLVYVMREINKKSINKETFSLFRSTCLNCSNCCTELRVNLIIFFWSKMSKKFIFRLDSRSTRWYYLNKHAINKKFKFHKSLLGIACLVFLALLEQIQCRSYQSSFSLAGWEGFAVLLWDFAARLASIRQFWRF